MKILAIEASGLTAGCAVACDGKLIGDYNIQYQKTHSQTLVPMLDELKRMTELDLSTLDAIAITEGPGSFTGLRIGLTVMNTLADSLRVPIVGEVGELWQDRALERLRNNENDRIVLPLYGAEAYKTQPRK